VRDGQCVRLLIKKILGKDWKPKLTWQFLCQ
jgi:hypothetical protein